MSKIIMILFIAVSSFHVKAEKNTSKLMKLIQEEEKALLAIPLKKMPPTLYWKLMLLNMEKFRIVRSEENKILLAESPEKISKKGREHYFRRSLVFYKKIKKLGNFIVKKWPKFSHNHEIYYNLAIVTIERNNQNEIVREVEYYLKKALQHTSKKSTIYRRIVVKLADHYYNLKKYVQASRYYRMAVKFNKDKWHTRYLFNLAWSLMSIKKMDEARKHIRDSLSLSILGKKNGQYVDYSDNVLDSLPLFIDENDLKKSIEFFENKVSFISQESLLKAAESAQGFGKYELADYFLKKAFVTALKKKGWTGASEIVKKMLDFYLKVRRDKKFIKFARYLAEKNIFDKKQNRNISERIKRHIRVLQDKATVEETKNIIFNFDTLKILNPVEKSTYSFYQGEVFFSQKKHLKALKYYRKAMDDVIKSNAPNDKTVVKKIFDSMIKSLDESRMADFIRNKWNKYIYINHLKIYPVSNRSRKMYQKLYNIYYKEKKYEKCKKILLSYIKNYPHRKNGKVVNKSDVDKQQFMISQIIDYYIEKGKYARALKEIEWLKREEFAFDESYVDKVSKIFYYKVFESVKKEKDRKIRREKYKNIYNDESFPSFVRSDSAWYTGEAFLKSQKSSKAFLWARKSLKLLEDTDSLKRQKSVLEMVVGMIYLEDFVSAEKLANLYFVRHCEEQYELKNDFYNATIIYSLAEGKKVSHIMKNFKKGHQCRIERSILSENIKVVSGFFRDNGYIGALKKMYQIHGSGLKERKYFKDLFLDFYWESFIAREQDAQRSALDLLSDERFSKDKDVNGVIAFHQFVKKLNKKSVHPINLYAKDDNFNEKVFNQKIEKEVMELNEFKTNLEKIMASGHPQIVVYGSWILYKKIWAFGDAVLKVVPLGVDENYRKNFLQMMKQFGGKFLQEARKKKRELGRIVRKSDILPGIYHNGSIGEIPFVLHW